MTIIYSKSLEKGSSLLFSLILLVVIVWVGWLFFYKDKFPRIVLPDATLINVELAVTDTEKIKGLSGRLILPDDRGMLFVFPRLDRHSIWMKDMNFPLDIIWLDQDFRIVDMAKSASLSSYPNTFTPKSNAGFVLEVNSGFADRHGLRIGDVLIYKKE